MSDLLCSAKLGAMTLALLLSATSLSALASVTPDRTRLIFNESDKSISVTLRNNDPKLPYLAQSWIEDEKGNKITLQIALQTRIKLFWRPKALEKVSMKSPWQHKVTLTRSGQAFTVNNPTPYYVIISNASAQKNGNPAAGFSPLVIEPKTTVPLNVKMDSVPVLTYVNDFGARMPLFFQCNGNSCQVDEEQSRKG